MNSLVEAVQDVEDFHIKFGAYLQLECELPEKRIRDLRKRLLEEEFYEYLEAENEDDLVGIADSLADLIYVAIGCAIAYGIPLAKVWDEVQASNMAKVGGTTRPDGKILKPEGWKPPNIQGIIDEHNTELKLP